MAENPTANNCSILSLNAPNGLQFGIDYCMWTTGPKFMGINRIPPGAHFIYWSVQAKLKDFDAEEVGYKEESEGVIRDEFRTGLFVYLEPAQVIVKRWNDESETFESMSEETEEQRYIQGVRNRDFDGNLGPYPVNWFAQWQEVSRFITREVIERIEPLSKFIGSSIAEYQDKLENPKILVDDKSGIEEQGRSEAEELKAEIEDLPGFSGLLYFCDIPKPKIKPGSSASEITRVSHDRSETLNSIIEELMAGDANQLLGELQFSYVCFLLSHNFEAFDHWKSLIILLCHCDAAVSQRPELFADFIRVLHCHLTQTPDDFFSDNLLSGNFFIQCLANLCELCSDASLPPQLRKRTDYLKSVIVKKFGVSIDDLMAASEDGPVVVDEEEPLYNFEANGEAPKDDEINVSEK